MPRFYLDYRDGDYFLADEDGIELASSEDARAEATSILAQMARDILHGTKRRELVVEVSDENRKPLFRTALSFEVRPVD